MNNSRLAVLAMLGLLSFCPTARAMYVENDPANNSDPMGLTCTTDKAGAVQDCKFDSGTAGTAAQRKAYLGAFAKAVKILQKDPSKLITVTVNGKSFTITGGALAGNMIGRNLVASPGRESDSGAETAPNAQKVMTTTVTPRALAGATVPGIADVRTSSVGPIDPVKSAERYQEIEAVHDAGLHGSAGEQKTFGIGNSIFDADPNWNPDHQDEYNAKSADALGIDHQ
jgi:hypothetical protein